MLFSINYLKKKYKNSPYKFIIRTMMNSRCKVTINTAFYCMQAISNNQMLEHLKVNDKTSFNTSMGMLALDPLLGTPQHKKTIIGHMFNVSMQAETFYRLSKHSAKITTNEPKGPSAHVMTELPVLEALLDRYGSDINNVHVTSDTMPVSVEGQKQTNLDYVVTMANKNKSSFLDRIIGLKKENTPLIRYHDCKDGGGILKHSTRGSLGVITFDKSGQNIQTTPQIITQESIMDFNYERLQSLKCYISNNNIEHYFKHTLDHCYNLLKTSDKSIFEINLTIENLLFHNIQKHPAFPRSISFVFLQKVDFEDNAPINFKQHLLDSLNTKRNHLHPYNLDKKGDAREFYIALLKAYQSEVDKDIYAKLLHLKHSGVPLNNYFNDILTLCMKSI